VSDLAFGISRNACNHPELGDAEWQLFQEHFETFPFDQINLDSIGFELGAGTGLWSSLISQVAGRIHLIDSDNDQLTRAKQLCQGDSFSFHVAEFDHFEMLEDSSMDFGIALESLHHSPSLPKTLAALGRKLRPGAPLLIFLLYRPQGLVRQALTFARDRVYRARTGQSVDRRYSREEVVKLMNAADFENIRFSEKGAFWTAVGIRR